MRYLSGGNLSETEHPGRDRGFHNGQDPADVASRLPGGAALVVESERVNDCWVVSAHGEVDLATFRQIESALDVGRSTADELLLDLRKVDFLDTSGLRLIFQEQDRARTSGYRFRVVRGPAEIQRLLEIAGFAPDPGMLIDSPAEVCGE